MRIVDRAKARPYLKLRLLPPNLMVQEIVFSVAEVGTAQSLSDPPQASG